MCPLQKPEQSILASVQILCTVFLPLNGDRQEHWEHRNTLLTAVSGWGCKGIEPNAVGRNTLADVVCKQVCQLSQVKQLQKEKHLLRNSKLWYIKQIFNKLLIILMLIMSLFLPLPRLLQSNEISRKEEQGTDTVVPFISFVLYCIIFNFFRAVCIFLLVVQMVQADEL